MKPVTLTEILLAREERAQRQAELLSLFHRPLICFTMNIAGPVKNNPLVERGFRLGVQLLEQQLERVHAAVLHRESHCASTGCEAFYVVDAVPADLKQWTMELEEGTSLGRLFDMDVLAPDGKKLERMGDRPCLICGKPGKVCARSRAHTVEELQARTTGILQCALNQNDRETAAELAVRALLYEVCVTPKPGLVDRNNSGSHRDMNLYTFLNSSAALWPYFHQCTQIGQETVHRLPEKTFAALRLPGKLAENAMLHATGGVNTHKGAIFTLGVLCGALGRLERQQWRCPETVLQECAAMTTGLTARDFAGLTEQSAVTAGEKLYICYGATGIRGQMEAGLPAVLLHGLPVLEAQLSRGADPDTAGSAALMALIASTEDTNLMARGGLEGWKWAVEAAAEAKNAAALDQAFIQRNLSPGGCADLLAVCWLLHFLKEEETEKAHG